MTTGGGFVGGCGLVGVLNGILGVVYSYPVTSVVGGLVLAWVVVWGLRFWFTGVIFELLVLIN